MYRQRCSLHAQQSDECVGRNADAGLRDAVGNRTPRSARGNRHVDIVDAFGQINRTLEIPPVGQRTAQHNDNKHHRQLGPETFADLRQQRTFRRLRAIGVS